MNIDTSAMCLVLFPVAIKYVAISMPKLSSATRFIVTPLSLILCTVWPNLDAIAMALFLFPLAFVDGAVIKYEFFSEVDLRVFLFVIFLFFKYCKIAYTI